MIASGKITFANAAFRSLVGDDNNLTTIEALVPGVSRAIEHVHAHGVSDECRARISGRGELVVWIVPFVSADHEVQLLVRIIDEAA